MYQEYYNNIKNRVLTTFASADETTAAEDLPSTAPPATDGTRRLEAGRQRRGIFDRQRQQQETVGSQRLRAVTQEDTTENLVSRTSAFLKALQDDTEDYMSSQQEGDAEFVGAFGADGAEFDAAPSRSGGLASRPPARSGDGFLGLIDQYEGGGDYSALLGFSNRNRFDNVDVTNMTLEQIDEFATGPYAAWSKQWKRENKHGNPNIPSTPMGRYQFVNTTLQAQAKKMGLDPATTRFTPAVQDAMFDNYLQERISREDTMAGKRRQLRNAWEGFNRVPDQRLDAAILQLSSQ